MRDKQAREDIFSLKNLIWRVVKNIGMNYYTNYQDGSFSENFGVLESDYKPWETILKDYVECSTCGCLIKKDKAIKAQSMVDKMADLGLWGKHPTGEKEIKTEYFCRYCKKKK